VGVCQTGGMTNDEPIRVVDDAEAARYEIFVGDTLAGFATYRDQSGVRTVVHTEIEPEFEHRGLGDRLAHEMLDDIRRRGLRLIPRCPFVARFVATHPDYADLVTT